MSEAISFFTVSSQYLHTSKLLLEKMYEYENMHIIVTDDESWEYYEEKTKYSDFNIILPVLFNLYHGVNAAALCPAVDVVNCPYIDGIGVHM